MEAFDSSGMTPKRSLLFALWDGEELGMLGSRHWIAHPTVLSNQIPTGDRVLVPTIEGVNGPAGGEIDLLVDWWAFGMSRMDR